MTEIYVASCGVLFILSTSKDEKRLIKRYDKQLHVSFSPR